MTYGRDAFTDFTVKWATSRWETEAAKALRRQVFCDEQRLFSDDDSDETDSHAQTIVALANCGGWHERVVGTVRIHCEAGDVWWGSRLALDRQFRGTNLSSALIKLAVGSARHLGCKAFYARVQSQNVLLFRRLHWHALDLMSVLGKPHALMQADLDEYQPFAQPTSGFVLSIRPQMQTGEILSVLLHPIQTKSNRGESLRHVV